MEDDFLVSQVGAAELNQFKLENRHEELSENISNLRIELEYKHTRDINSKQRWSKSSINDPNEPANKYQHHISEHLPNDAYYD